MLLVVMAIVLVVCQFTSTSAQERVVFSDGTVGYTNCGPTGGSGGSGTFSAPYVSQGYQSYASSCSAGVPGGGSGTFQHPVSQYVPQPQYAYGGYTRVRISNNPEQYMRYYKYPNTYYNVSPTEVRSYQPQRYYQRQVQYPPRTYSYQGVPRSSYRATYQSGPFGMFGRSSVSYGNN